MSESINNLGIRLTDLINDFSDDVLNNIESRLDETADQILDYIKTNCPKSNGGSNHLSDSFDLTVVGEGANKTIFISSKTKGRLVHLVELGFKHRNGKFVAARPFMRPAYETFTPQMLEDIKNIIKNGGR